MRLGPVLRRSPGARCAGEAVSSSEKLRTQACDHGSETGRGCQALPASGRTSPCAWLLLYLPPRCSVPKPTCCLGSLSRKVPSARPCYWGEGEGLLCARSPSLPGSAPGALGHVGLGGRLLHRCSCRGRWGARQRADPQHRSPPAGRAAHPSCPAAPQQVRALRWSLCVSLWSA